MELVEHDAGNFTLPNFPGLIVKEGYWRWSQRNLAGTPTSDVGGNAIDFFMLLLGLSIHDAMRHITDS